MADIKILDLTTATEITETTDYIPVVDTSDTAQDSTGTTKKATIRKLLGDRVLPDTIVGTTETQTLSNKTLTSPVINTPTGDVVTPTGTQTLTNKTLTSPKVDTINEKTAGDGVNVDNCLIRDGKASDSDKVDGLHIYSVSVVISQTPDSNNTITHNLGTESQRIFAINGDYNANSFTIVGVNFIDTNSFSVRTSGGVSGSARINYIIFY